MSARRKKEEPKKISRFLSFVSGQYPLFICVLFLLNCLLFLLSYKQTKPVVSLLFHETTNYVYKVHVITSLVDSVSSDFVSTNSLSIPDLPSLRVHYDYFEYEQVPSFRYYGRIYKPGDICSLGVVESVFPDVVFCSQGQFVNNGEDSRFNGRESSSDRRFNK